MVVALERPRLAKKPQLSKAQRDLRLALFTLCKKIPPRHTLTIVPDRNGLIYQGFMSSSPREIADEMERLPFADFTCSTRLAKYGCPDAIPWAFCLETVITDVTHEESLGVATGLVAEIARETLETYAHGYEWYHLRYKKHLYSLAYKNWNTLAFLACSRRELSELPERIKEAISNRFCIEPSLDDYAHYLLEGGPEPVSPMHINVGLTEIFPLPREACDYDLQMSDLFACVEVAA